MEKKAKRDALQDFDAFTRDVKAQFNEQQKLIDQRIEQQNLILSEMADFCKKRGEIEAQYAGALDKLLRRQRPITANSSVSRTWHSLLESTRKMRDGHLLFANNFSNKMGEYLSQMTSGFASLLKRYRDMHSGLQQDEVGRLKFYREKLEAYRLAVDRLGEDRMRASKCSLKMGANQGETQSGTGTSKKERDLARALKALDESTQRLTSTRNEYLLAVTSENLALDRLLNSDFALATFYLHWFFRKSVAHAFRFALVGDTYSLQVKRCEDTLRSSIDELDSLDLPFPGSTGTNSCNASSGTSPNGEATELDLSTLVEQLASSQADYRMLLELSPTAFTPRSLAFEPHRDDSENELCADNDTVMTALINVRSGCHEASNDARTRIERLVADMRQLKHELTALMNQSLDDQLSMAKLPAHGDAFGMMPVRSNSFESLLQLYMLNTPSNLATQIVARQAQETIAVSESLLLKLREYLLHERQFSVVRAKLSLIEPLLRQFDTSEAYPNYAPNTTSGINPLTRPGSWHYGEVFGMRLIDYVKMNDEAIPTVLRSCIRFLTDNALHRPGIFRINGSLTEVLELRARFNSGENPLETDDTTIDVNSVASLLKLYLRELPEPLLPPGVAQSLVELRSTYQNDELQLRTKLHATLKTSVPQAHYVVLRYLFAFLNHVTAYDENMMDAYNLAVCFGPTVTQPLNDVDAEAHVSNELPTSSVTPSAPLSTVFESTLLVNKQRCINEIISDLIVNYGELFDENVAGPLYHSSPIPAAARSFNDSATRPHPSVSDVPQEDGNKGLLVRSFSTDHTTADSGKSGSVLSADSYSYDDEPPPFASAGTRHRALPQSQSSNATDSPFTLNYHKASSPSPIAHSNYNFASATSLPDRASNSTLPVHSAVAHELSDNLPPKASPVTKTASISRFHQVSFDWPPHKLVDSASTNRPLNMSSSISVSSETLSVLSDKLPADSSWHNARIGLTGNSPMLPEQLGAPPAPLRRPPPVARKPVFTKK